MAEELDDGVFWLPPKFLTDDDDILMDFSDKAPLFSGSDPDSSSGTGSDPVTESDDDELLSSLSFQLARSSIEASGPNPKGSLLSGSPKSTLYGYVGSGRDGSSLSSPNQPPSPSSKEADAAAATLNLLNEAAGEVARVKMRRENKAAAVTGTGYFDCSLQGQLRNPIPPNKYPMFYHQPPAPQFHPFAQGMVWGQTKANRPLGLPPSAWPPLQGQNHHLHHQHHLQNHRAVAEVKPVFMGQSAGTGVFLPRQVPTQTENRKKNDAIGMKRRTGKRQSQPRRSGRPLTTPKQSEIKLPQEWTY